MYRFNIVIDDIAKQGFVWDIVAKDIYDALEQICRKCMEEDNTGYFFELEYADVEALEAMDGFYKITVDGIKLGVIVSSQKIVEEL